MYFYVCMTLIFHVGIHICSRLLCRILQQYRLSWLEVKPFAILPWNMSMCASFHWFKNVRLQLTWPWTFQKTHEPEPYALGEKFGNFIDWERERGDLGSKRCLSPPSPNNKYFLTSSSTSIDDSQDHFRPPFMFRMLVCFRVSWFPLIPVARIPI